MSAQSWYMAMLIACCTAPLLLLFGYYAILPLMVTYGYRTSLLSDQFTGVDGSEGAGSVDIAYYTLYFDVRNHDLLIEGPVPDAVHWQFGAFTGATRLIDGAYSNQSTFIETSPGRYLLRVTAHPSEVPEPVDGAVNVLDCSSQKTGMIIFRVVLPQSDVVLPDVHRVSIGKNNAS